MGTKLTYLQDLQNALHYLMGSSDKTVLIGEDLFDPYGGAFKVTKGLSTEFPDRLISTPISESAIVGVGLGMALRGMRPICEIMFGDFIALTADQIVNHILKLGPMYGSDTYPVIIRTPMGGKRGYGPTHSQSLEKMFLGLPDLTMLAPNIFTSPGELLKLAYEKAKPTLFIEYKLDYPRELLTESEGSISKEIEVDAEGFPVAVLRNYSAGSKTPDLTVLSYGGQAGCAVELLEYFAKEEIWIDFVCPTSLNYSPVENIISYVDKSKRLLCFEESCAGFNWSDGIACRVYDQLGRQLEAPIIRVNSKSPIIPANHTEELKTLTSIEDVKESIIGIFS